MKNSQWIGVVFCLFTLGILPASAQAELLRIIHTNDLHSMMEMGHSSEEGGYARIKGVMDALKAKSQAEGVETLSLSAGDFMEGSQFYLANRGRESMRVMSALGFDAVAIGNHDWMMGAEELDRIVEEVPPSFAFLGANFIVNASRKTLKSLMKPYQVFEKAGLRIGVLGLTTAEYIYRWPADRIAPPIATAQRELKKLRKQTDFVIALTHLGVAKDHKLVKRTRGIDIVVGGHSHTVLDEVEYGRDRRRRWVPIVQTGAHGQYVGELLVDLVPGQPVEVIHYELHPVNAASPASSEVSELVSGARGALHQEYGADWLSEIIGYSEVHATYSNDLDHPWNRFVTDAFLDSTGADAAIHVPSFTFPYNMTGPVSREDLFAFFPRIQQLEQRKGWSIWTGWMPGFWLKQVMKLGNKAGLVIHFRSPDGRPVHGNYLYKVAIPEAVAWRMEQLPVIDNLLLRNIRDSRVLIWDSFESRLKRVGTIDYSDDFAPRASSRAAPSSREGQPISPLWFR